MSCSQISQIKALEAEYTEAMAIGDRVKAGGVLKKLRDLLANADPEKLKAWIGLIGGLLGVNLPLDAAGEPTAQALGVSNVLSVGEVQAAGILDNPQLWIQLFTLIMEFIRQIRGSEASAPAGG